MKKQHYLLTAIAAYIILLVITIPAKVITDIINENTPANIQGVNGTVWQGSAYIITINNLQFKKTNWSFESWKLLTGKVAVDVDSQFLGNKVSAEFGSSFTGRYFANEVSAKIAAREAAKLANIPLVQLDGMINLDIKHAQWKQGELPLATGTVQWKNASVTVAERAALGNVNIILSESDQQLLNADIKNQGGDILISGSAKLLANNNYALDLKLMPTASANNNIKQSLGFFAQKQKNGEYLLKKSGPLNQLM